VVTILVEREGMDKRRK